MANSLELRSPFLDYRLVEMASTIPAEWKVRNRSGKAILKEAFCDKLPICVLEPRKRGFSLPLADWLRGKLRPTVEDMLSDREFFETGILNQNEVRLLAREHWSGARDRSKQLWQLLVFWRWWAKHVSCDCQATQTTTLAGGYQV